MKTQNTNPQTSLFGFLKNDLDSLNARVILNRMMYHLAIDACLKSIPLKPPLEVDAIAHDPTNGLRGIGGFIYSQIAFVRFGEKIWLIAHSDGYFNLGGTDPISDIIAIEVSKTLEEQEAREILAKGSYFKNSLLIAQYDGKLILNEKNRFQESLAHIPQVVEKNIILHEPDTRWQYHPQLATILATEIRKALT
jgi:hypothetical protein